MNPLKRINAVAAIATIPSLLVIDSTGIGVDADTITINAVVFEIDDDATTTAGNVAVDISGGGSAAQVATALAAAINASSLNALGYSATAETNNSIEQVVVTSPRPFTASELLTNATIVTSAGLPEPAEEQYEVVSVKRVPDAAEVTSGVMHFAFGGTVNDASVIARVTSTGARKYLTDLLTFTGTRVVIATAGATTFAATDTVTVVANVKKTF